jgi:hypothetical protein
VPSTALLPIPTDLDISTLGRGRIRICAARLFIADVTGANPNVYLEIGFAWGHRSPDHIGLP